MGSLGKWFRLKKKSFSIVTKKCGKIYAESQGHDLKKENISQSCKTACNKDEGRQSKLPRNKEK